MSGATVERTSSAEGAAVVSRGRVVAVRAMLGGFCFVAGVLAAGAVFVVDGMLASQTRAGAPTGIRLAVLVLIIAAVVGVAGFFADRVVTHLVTETAGSGRRSSRRRRKSAVPTAATARSRL